jgi:hypothetical protein
MRFAPTSFRPAFGRVLSIIVALIALGGLIGFVVAGDAGALIRYGWGLLLLGAVAFAVFWLPSLSVAEHEITVRNVFSTVHVPWTAIQRIDTKYALTLYTPRGKVTAWASPAPSRYASQVGPSRDVRLAARDGETSIRPGDLISSQSGAAAYVIRRHWEELRDDGHLDSAVIEPGAFRREPHWATIAVLAVLAVATVLGYVL